MLYDLYEMNHAAIAPWRAMADAGRVFWRNPANPLAGTAFGRQMSASLDMFERATRRYGKPVFNIETVRQGKKTARVAEETVWSSPFCNLLHFRKSREGAERKLLIVAPMSGHYATLLRGTVEAMLPQFDVYITDWVDARTIPRGAGDFDLDDYIDTVITLLQELGPGTSIMAVCQPSVPVLAAVSLMSEDKDPCLPPAMILMGGPIDTRRNPTAVNNLALEKGIPWFRQNVIVRVPFPNPGVGREVYPGFLQLNNFVAMNFDRHVDAHRELFWHLVAGDGDSADKHTVFYDEYLSVMDLTAEFYLQTVERVFIEHSLPRGVLSHRGRRVDTRAVEKTALFTVEGERDDISGAGQTEAAHDLCLRIPRDMRGHHLLKGVGHYGVFNGSRFRSEAVPLIAGFIGRHAPAP